MSEIAERLRARFRSGGENPAELIRDVDEALAFSERDADLWCLRGDVIQSSEQSEIPLHEAKSAYERAVALRPGFVHALEELAFYLDSEEDDPEAAELLFRRAIESGGGVWSHLGLARVLAQLGDTMEALAVLDRAPTGSDALRELREEILAGEWSPDD